MTYDDTADGRCNRLGTAVENVRFRETGRQVTVHYTCIVYSRACIMLQVYKSGLFIWQSMKHPAECTGKRACCANKMYS